MEANNEKNFGLDSGTLAEHGKYPKPKVLPVTVIAAGAALLVLLFLLAVFYSFGSRKMQESETSGPPTPAEEAASVPLPPSTMPILEEPGDAPGEVAPPPSVMPTLEGSDSGSGSGEVTPPPPAMPPPLLVE